MRSSFLQTFYDICYLALLCTVILIAFYVVFLPAQPTIASMPSQTLPVLQHTTLSSLSVKQSTLCAVGCLLYLKCIWRLIYR